MTEGMKKPVMPTRTMTVPAMTKVVVSPMFSARNPVPEQSEGCGEQAETAVERHDAPQYARFDAV